MNAPDTVPDDTDVLSHIIGTFRDPAAAAADVGTGTDVIRGGLAADTVDLAHPAVDDGEQGTGKFQIEPVGEETAEATGKVALSELEAESARTCEGLLATLEELTMYDVMAGPVMAELDQALRQYPAAEAIVALQPRVAAVRVHVLSLAVAHAAALCTDGKLAPDAATTLALLRDAAPHQADERFRAHLGPLLAQHAIEAVRALNQKEVVSGVQRTRMRALQTVGRQLGLNQEVLRAAGQRLTMGNDADLLDALAAVRKGPPRVTGTINLDGQPQ